MPDPRYTMTGPGDFRVSTPDRGGETYRNATVKVIDGTLYIELPRGSRALSGSVAIYSPPFRVDSMEGANREHDA